jgi:transposase
MKLLHEICQTVEQGEYSRGRPTIPTSDMIFCSVMKVYTMFSLRRFTSTLKESLDLNYIEKSPCFASVGHFLQKEEITPILQDLVVKSSEPLKSVEYDFAVDASGFSTCRYKRWFDFKYGKERDFRIWIKAHIMCGTKTNIVTSVRLSESKKNDCKYFKPLVEETAKNFEFDTVTADKAYSSRESYKLVDKHGGEAFIPFRSNATGASRGSYLWKRMYHYFMYNQEEFMKYYHKRSNVESTFFMIKSKFGDSLKSKTKTAQMNEVICKILCHNLCVLIQEAHELENSRLCRL